MVSAGSFNAPANVCLQFRPIFTYKRTSNLANFCLIHLAVSRDATNDRVQKDREGG